MTPRCLLILLFCMVPLLSGAATLPIHKDQSFTQARARLVSAKWKPVKMHDPHDEFEGVERQLVKRGFMEFDSCSIDSSRCILYYRKGKSCLRLDTLGEQVNDMTIVQWSSECPEQPTPAKH